ncbi:DUF6185 family protein, partial [Nonomuraea sp. NPDC049709]|uniref:DUF6185 family protein n=1 Tax=Nonomuraea sp. NPDC049709 TaxID=3154736 RepID=UPI00342CD4C6
MACLGEGLGRCDRSPGGREDEAVTVMEDSTDARQPAVRRRDALALPAALAGPWRTDLTPAVWSLTLAAPMALDRATWERIDV